MKRAFGSMCVNAFGAEHRVESEVKKKKGRIRYKGES